MRKEGYSMIFDGHSDIFSDVRYKREAGETQVLKNHHLDRLRKGGIGGACFVIWADTYNGHAPKDEMEAIVKGIKGEMAETKEFVLIHNVEELKAAEAAGKFAILLGIEGLAGIGDALVIGSDEDVVQLGTGFGGLVDPPDHGFAQHIRQRLAGHTGACITGRDHSDCFHGCTSV